MPARPVVAKLAGMKLLIQWFLLAAALMLVSHLYNGVTVQSLFSALIAALVIGLLNTVLRPVLVILTFPATMLSFGLFLFVINALMFWAASGLLAGFHVRDFWAALIGSLLYTLLGLLIHSALERLFPNQ